MRVDTLGVRQRRRRRVGRGQAAGGGTTAGRGTKGQKSRAGKGLRPGFEGGRTSLIMRLPKVRGFKSPHPKPETVRWDKIVKRAPGGLVDKEKLWRWGLISSPRAHVKVVGPATKPKRSYTLRVEGVTKTVRQAIESSGGKIELPRAKTPAGKK